MRPLLLLILAVLVLAGTVLGKESVPLRVEGLFSAETTQPSGLAEYRVLQEFKRRFPHVNVLPTEGLRIEGLGTEVTSLMMIAGGIAPDILSVNFRKIDSYVRQGFLYPLDEFISRAESKNPGWRKTYILPQVEPVIRRPRLQEAPHYYALPVQYQVMGLFYNRQLFRRAGLPLRAPRDWTELVEFSRRISALDPRYYGMAMGTGQQASWHLMNFLWSSGAEAVVEVAPNEWRAAFNTEGAIDAFEFYYRLVEGEKLAVRGDTTTMNNSGEMRRVGMQFGYIGSQLSLDPNIWGFGAVPLGPTGIRGAEVNARMMGIFAGVKDPKVREAAWDFISFFGSDAAQKIRVDAFIEMGLVNQINPTDLRKFGYTAFLEMAEPGLEQSVQTAFATAKPEPYGKNCNLVYVEMTYPLDQVLFNPMIADAWHRGNRETIRREIKTILDTAVAQTNERMLGVVPAKTMQHRRAVAWVVAFLILLAFVAMARAILKTFAHVGQGTSRARGIQKYYAWGLLFIPLALSFTWQYIPLARGALVALLDYQLLLKSTFVGIDNFANVIFDLRFWRSLGATFHFAFWLLTAGFATPIVLAYLLHLVPRQKMLFRTIYYLPALLSGAALFILWRQFFDANGLINEILSFFGLPFDRKWSDDPFLAMLSCVIPAVWAGAGPGCLIYLAALKTIPEEQFEAAEIDGAGFWKKTRHIVFPGLKPLIIINFVGAVSAAFQSSQNVLIMTGGGPNGATEVAALRIFYEAFMFLNFGPATAMAWILGAMLIGLTVIQLKRLSQMEFRSGGR